MSTSSWKDWLIVIIQIYIHAYINFIIVFIIIIHIIIQLPHRTFKREHALK